MSWLSKLTHIHLGNIGAPVGAVLGSVIPGVGTSLGAALGQGLGSIGSGKSVGQSLASGAGTYLGARALSALGIGGGGGGSVDPEGDALYGAETSPGGGGGIMDSIGSFLKSPGGAAAISGLGSLAGGIIQGKGQGQVAQADRDWQREQFAKNYAISSGTAAMGAQKSLDAAPLRDKAQYLLQARMGMAPGAFVPRDMFNPSSAPPSMGGIDPNAVQRTADSYKPGAGGVTTGVQQQLLKSIGYGQANPPQPPSIPNLPRFPVQRRLPVGRY